MPDWLRRLLFGAVYVDLLQARKDMQALAEEKRS